VKKLLAVVSLFALIAVGLYLEPAIRTHAQQLGVATTVGGVTPVNQFQNSSATGLAGAVTNPASNFVVQVAGGPIYFAGVITELAQTQLTLPASSTNLIVFNGTNQQVYAKQAVTGPGSSGTTVGVPASVLFATPNVEVPLATVVCNATACGNGGNGSITDNRPLASFPAGLYAAGHLNTAAANKDIAGVITLAAGTATLTFSNVFQVAPICVATDQTAANAVKTAPTASNVVFTGTTTDVIQYVCVGNPN
jgi:hypothetical protein